MKTTLRQLRYFRALAETRHFGRAAEKMYVSQPAMSVQIKDLEANLGVQLVERHTRELVITPIGHEVLRRTEEILRNVRELEQSARWQSGLAGRLSIGVIPTIAPYLLPRVLPELRAQHGRLDLRLREAQTEVLLADLQNGRLDVAVVALPAGAGLIELPLFEDRFLLAGSLGSLDRLRAGVKHFCPTALDPDQLLLLDEGHCLADQALEVCKLERSLRRADLGASSLSTLCGLAAGGFGLTFLPEIAVAQELAAHSGLGLQRFDAPEPLRRIGLVRRPLTHDDGWFTELAAHLRKAAAGLLASVHMVGLR